MTRRYPEEHFFVGEYRPVFESNTRTYQESMQPNYPLISQDEPAAILDALILLNVFRQDESITSVAKAGEGNMNLVLRVTTDRQSVIVKQARPWVEKYRDIPAPAERILSEIEFYRRISNDQSVSDAMPSVLASDVSRRLMVLEDLGQSSDYATLYSSQKAATEVDAVFRLAVGWVARLHGCDAAGQNKIGCSPLLELNHQYIFSVPLQDPPVADLDSVCEGLADASRALCADESVRRAMERLGKIYLESDGPLLHGDFHPGSWLNTEKGFQVIDPEFCFCGAREFELGVIAAHWIFCGSEASSATIDRVCDLYSKEVSRELLLGFTGAELVRRLIGVAQPPLDADLNRRVEWLQCGEKFLK